MSMRSMPNRFKEMVGENIVTLRMLKGMTQRRLAQKIGVLPSTICQYEHGSRMPNLYVLSMIADALDTSIDYIVPRVDTSNVTRYDPRDVPGQMNMFDEEE